jgi:hypothetical protein
LRKRGRANWINSGGRNFSPSYVGYRIERSGKKLLLILNIRNLYVNMDTKSKRFTPASEEVSFMFKMSFVRKCWNRGGSDRIEERYQSELQKCEETYFEQKSRKHFPVGKQSRF